MKPLLPLDRVQNWDQLLVLTPVAASWGGRGHVTILCLSFSHVRQGWELWPFRDDFLRSTIKRALKLHVFITDSWWLALSLWACILPTWRNKEMRLHPWDWPAGCLILHCLVPIRFAYLILYSVCVSYICKLRSAKARLLFKGQWMLIELLVTLWPAWQGHSL